MAFIFPSNPTLNQTYVVGGRTWVWNGTTWQAQGTVTVPGPTGPTGAAGATGPMGATPTNYVSNTGGSIIIPSANGIIPLVMRGAVGQSVNLQEWQNSTGTAVGYMDVLGNFTAAADITTNSDIRVKENIEPILNGLNKVLSLQGITYNLIAQPGEARHLGLIAQDVELVAPEAVSEHDGVKSVAYGNLVGLLVEAIKEQQIQIEDLRSRLDGI
jgi:hypothetical protein